MDVSDMIDYNVSILNSNDLTNSFFCLKEDDPTMGFSFDATRVAGHVYPEITNEGSGKLYVVSSSGVAKQSHLSLVCLETTFIVHSTKSLSFASMLVCGASSISFLEPNTYL